MSKYRQLTPPPRDILRKQSSNNRTQRETQLAKTHVDAHELCLRSRRQNGRDNGQSTIGETRGSHTRDGPPHDEHCGGLGCAAEGGSDLEDEEEGEEGPLEHEFSV